MSQLKSEKGLGLRSMGQMAPEGLAGQVSPVPSLATSTALSREEPNLRVKHKFLSFLWKSDGHRELSHALRPSSIVHTDDKPHQLSLSLPLPQRQLPMAR